MFIDQPDWWERSAFFLQANVNKRDLTLDLAARPVARLVLRLIAHRRRRHRELHAPRARELRPRTGTSSTPRNPRAVLVRMPAFGLDGPWRDRPGFAQTMEQVTGLAWLTGHVEDQPRIQRGPCDPNGGMHAAFATLVGAGPARPHRQWAASSRRRCSRPRSPSPPSSSIEWTAYGTRLDREGNRARTPPRRTSTPPTTPSSGWRSRSRTTSEWQALCAVRRPDRLGRRPRAARHLLGRRARHDELDAVLVGVGRRPLASTTPSTRCIAAGVPAGAARRPPAGVPPSTRSCRPAATSRTSTHPVDRHPPDPGAAVPLLSGIDRWVRRPAPTFGAAQRRTARRARRAPPTRRAPSPPTSIIGTRPVGL